jgi:hypothetical protein
MKSKGIFTFSLLPNQHASLVRMQEKFSEVCNEISDFVVKTSCWSRVGLHNMLYKQLRGKYPELGSQMICNAIYCVSRISKQNYQRANTPCFELVKKGITPKISYSKTIPLIFDKNTLSIKGDLMTLFTLEGRIRFKANLPDDVREKFFNEGVKEIILRVNSNSCDLIFFFIKDSEDEDRHLFDGFFRVDVELAELAHVPI